MSNKEYKHIQHLVEIVEDIVLGFIVHKRFKNSKKDDYIAIEKLLEWQGNEVGRNSSSCS